MKPLASAAEMRAVPRSAGFRNGGVSYWLRDAGLPERRPALSGDADYDVCIVGGGYTGLWSAYYLKKARPDLRVAVLEREFAGFGAAGRNGGRLSAGIAGSRRRCAATHGKGAVVALQRAMMATVDEVIAVAAAEGVDADIAKGGLRLVATDAAEKDRLQQDVAELHEWGYWPEDLHLIDPCGEPRLQVAGAVAAAYTPHAARVHPAKLVLGLAAAVEALGVDILEGTAVTGIRPRTDRQRPCAVTAAGTVRADHVLRATEGFTANPPGRRRRWLPVNSFMIATEPLSDAMWRRIGWERPEVLSGAAPAYCYAQRTADGRIAVGGRGFPRRFGSARDAGGATAPQAVAELWRMLARMFPVAAGVPLAHAWSGALGVPRERCPGVGLDPGTGLGWAGGYADHGVAAGNLAGRTLRDLVLGERTDLTRLPWVGRRNPTRSGSRLRGRPRSDPGHRH